MKNSDFPESLLCQLNEHTNGGFMIFFVDKNGIPSYIPYTDNLVIAKGLLSYVEDIAEGIREIEKQQTIESFLGEEEN